MKADADGAESRSDAAQQLSASAWLTGPFALESGESDLCIGHPAPSEQQAMRAAGVAIQPAHKPTWLAESANVKRIADRRLSMVNTFPRMLKGGGSVKRGQVGTMMPVPSSTRVPRPRIWDPAEM